MAGLTGRRVADAERSGRRRPPGRAGLASKSPPASGCWSGSSLSFRCRRL